MMNHSLFWEQKLIGYQYTPEPVSQQKLLMGGGESLMIAIWEHFDIFILLMDMLIIFLKTLQGNFTEECIIVHNFIYYHGGHTVFSHAHAYTTHRYEEIHIYSQSFYITCINT